MPFDRVEPGEHHRLELLEAGERLRRPSSRFRDRVANLCVADLLDVCNQETDFADAKLLDRNRLGREVPELLGLVILPFGHERDLHALADDTVEHTNDDDDSP